MCAATAAGDPEAACAQVMAAMTDDPTHNDDVALLMLRRRPETRLQEAEVLRVGVEA